MKFQRYSTAQKLCIVITAASKEEAESKLLHFFNHNGSDAEGLHTIEHHDGLFSGYFWTSLTKFKRGLTSINLFRLLNNSEQFKGKAGGVLPIAKKMGEMELDSYEKLDYNPTEMVTKSYSHHFGFGSIVAEKPDTN